MVEPGTRRKQDEPRLENSSRPRSSRDGQVGRNRAVFAAVEIGGILRIAKRKVDEHTHSTLRKLGAADRTQAVAIALRPRTIDL